MKDKKHWVYRQPLHDTWASMQRQVNLPIHSLVWDFIRTRGVGFSRWNIADAVHQQAKQDIERS